MTYDATLDLDWTGGPGGQLVPRLTGGATTSSGKVWRFGKGVERGVGADGRLGRRVDYTFSRLLGVLGLLGKLS